MGLFGALKKVLGGVAKAGLSVVTRGVSDKVFAALKSRGEKPASVSAKRPKPSELTEQQNALANKMGQAVPKLKSTTVYVQAVKEPSFERSSSKGEYKSKRRYKRLEEPMSRMRDSMGAPKQRRVRARAGVRRGPPPGGLDLRAMAAEWRSAGKPGTWIGWIKSNPIRRPR